MNRELVHKLSEMLQEVTGFIYPNEIEIHWSILIVVYPYLTGLVAGGFILASLGKRFKRGGVRRAGARPRACVRIPPRPARLVEGRAPPDEPRPPGPVPLLDRHERRGGGLRPEG